jgi:hypothetical protein
MNIYLSHCILLRSPEDRWAPLRIYRSVTFRRKRGWKRACPCQKLRLMSKTTYHYIIKCVPLEKSRVSTFFLKTICVADVSNMSKASKILALKMCWAIFKASIAPPHYSGKDRKGRDNAGILTGKLPFVTILVAIKGLIVAPRPYAPCKNPKSSFAFSMFPIHAFQPPSSSPFPNLRPFRISIVKYLSKFEIINVKHMGEYCTQAARSTFTE